MNRIKTKLKTNMKQETLQDLLVVSTTSDSIEEFNSKEANYQHLGEQWKEQETLHHFNCNFNKLKQCPKRKSQAARDRNANPSCYRVR